MCKHPTEALMGTADGIVCRACGKKFTTFEEIHANAEAPAKAKAAEQPKQEKPENAPVEAAETPKKGRKKKANA